MGSLGGSTSIGAGTATPQKGKGFFSRGKKDKMVDAYSYPRRLTSFPFMQGVAPDLDEDDGGPSCPGTPKHRPVIEEAAGIGLQTSVSPLLTGKRKTSKLQLGTLVCSHV